MNFSEVILEVGSEGGSLTIFGYRSEKGWRFSRKVIDQSMLLLDENEPSIEHCSDIVDSWDKALTLLEPYRWHRLYPVAVHPEFKDMVFDTVLPRLKAENDTPRRQLSKWEELCGKT